jgi:two-component system OmpR family response regulator
MIKTKAKIVIIDDEPDYVKIIKMNLDSEFEVTSFHKPEEAVTAIRTSIPDAVLLDINFEGTDGFQIYDKIKTIRPELPVFFLSCNTAAEMIGKGLTTGGVDYFTKTMPPLEIITRLKARLETLKLTAALKCRDIELNPESREIRIQDKLITLTPKQYDIVKHFMENQDQMFSKYELKDLLWKEVHIDVNNIDTHMFHIRKKFDGKTEGIECRKGMGYILRSKKE